MEQVLVPCMVEFNIGSSWWAGLASFLLPKLCEKEKLILAKEKVGCHLLQEAFPDLIPTNLNWMRKDQIINVSGFAGHIVSATASQLFHCCLKSAVDNRSRNGHHRPYN